MSTPPLPKIDPESVAPADIARALTAIRTKIKDKQFAFLQSHYLAGKHRIVDDGRGKFADVVQHYGRVGGHLFRQLGAMPKTGYHLMWIAVQKNHRGQVIWQLRDNFAAALQITRWFDDVKLRVDPVDASHT